MMSMQGKLVAGDSGTEKEKSVPEQNHEIAAAVAQALRKSEELKGELSNKEQEIVQLEKDFTAHVQLVREEYHALRNSLDAEQDKMLASLRQQKAEIKEKLEQAKIELDTAHKNQREFYIRTFQQEPENMDVDNRRHDSPTHSGESSDEENRKKRDNNDGNFVEVEDTPVEVGGAKKDKDGEDSGSDKHENKTEKEREKLAKEKADKERAKQARNRLAAAASQSLQAKKTISKHSGGTSASSESKVRSTQSEDTEIRMDTDEKQYILKAVKNQALLSDNSYMATLQHTLGKYGIELQALTKAIQCGDSAFFDAILEKNPEAPTTVEQPFSMG